MKIESVLHEKKLLAIILRYGPIDPGVHFYTEDSNSLQLGKQLRKEGETVKPHQHKAVETKKYETLQEVLYVEKGKVEVIFYSDEKKEMDRKILQQNDLILLIAGGHGFEFKEETVLIEVKQGPFNPASTIKFEAK